MYPRPTPPYCTAPTHVCVEAVHSAVWFQACPLHRLSQSHPYIPHRMSLTLAHPLPPYAVHHPPRCVLRLCAVQCCQSWLTRPLSWTVTTPHPLSRRSCAAHPQHPTTCASTTHTCASKDCGGLGEGDRGVMLLACCLLQIEHGARFIPNSTLFSVLRQCVVDELDMHTDVFVCRDCNA